jgi:hypothetical protein
MSEQPQSTHPIPAKEEVVSALRLWRRAKLVKLLKFTAFIHRTVACSKPNLKAYLHIYILLKNYPSQMEAALTKARFEASDKNANQLRKDLGKLDFINFIKNFLITDWRMSKHAITRKAFWNVQILRVFIEMFREQMTNFKLEILEVTNKVIESAYASFGGNTPWQSVSQRRSP